MPIETKNLPTTIERIEIERGFVIELYRDHRHYENPATALPYPRGTIGAHAGCGGEVRITLLESKYIRQVHCRECGARKEIYYHHGTIGDLSRQFPPEEEKKKLRPEDDHHDG